MKKLLALMLAFIILVLSGCSGSMERILYPSSNGAALYYNEYSETKNRIKREDIKRGTNYNDLFLTEGITKGMTLEDVLYSEPREAVLDISTATEVFFMPHAAGETVLTEWINQCTLKYTFGHDGRVTGYEVINSKSNNTYTEYLYVMRALSHKYGECTTEIYKDEDNIIDNTKVKEDYKEVEKIIEFYETEFAKENVGIISQWVNDECIITVDFGSPDNCSIVYELTAPESSEKQE